MIQALRWLLHPYRYFREHGKKSWRVWLPGLGRVLVSGDPDLLAQLIYHPDLSGGKAHKALRATLGDDHLIVMWGQAHRQRSAEVRRALTAFAPDSEVVRLTREEVAAVPLNQPFSLHQLAHRISLRVILSGLLGPHREQPVLELSRSFQRSFSNPLLLFLPFLRRDWGPWSPWGRLLRRRQRLQQALLHQLETAPTDCIGARLAQTLPPQALASELLAMLIFGHETTAATFAWCFAQMRPCDRQRIQGGDSDYTCAFIEECLRLFPPVAQLTRVAEKDLRLGEWEVPAGSVVMPAIPLAHQSVLEPERFWPERFLTSPPPPRQYCPFGFGERICPGKVMALRQLVVMLQTMVQEFTLELEPGYQARPRRDLFLVVPQAGTPALRRA